jgi:tRNA-2-methylthio-N6-dimethylallyladenosine synthase
MKDIRKKLYIYTIGCQMNVYDSDRIAASLQAHGYDATPFLDGADLVIMNTCAIREKAEQKVFSFLGRLSEMKRNKPETILGVGGCVAQQEGRAILARMPHIDFVFGTCALKRLPGIIDRVEKKRCRVLDIEMTAEPEENESIDAPVSNGAVNRFVTIMRGCDNFCAYCVVPYVRGRETSRRPEAIVGEVQSLVASGVREVTLLGQNVNSYGKKEFHCSFSRLLAKINSIDGLLRIRFTTSHPKDLSDDLISCFGDLKKLCRHIHLPVQSGSDPILKRMNRKYDRKRYLDLIEKLRTVCPAIAITTDVIVGFPGETEQDFNDTLRLIKEVGYDNLFAFKYSDRPNAPAAGFPEKVSETEKTRRLDEVLELQKSISIERNLSLVGSVQTILVDGHSKTKGRQRAVQWTGRTSANKIVNFSADGLSGTGDAWLGRLIPVRIEKALAHSLIGMPETPGPIRIGTKGEDDYVA